MPDRRDPLAIYDQITHEQLLDPLPDGPALQQTVGATDFLVERTNNSLRPEDLALGQPPQDPDWRPA